MDDRISSCLGPGTAIVVGTVDEAGAPSCCRGFGIAADDGLTQATVYLPLGPSRDTLANLATTRRVAVVITRPIEHTSIQLKGTGTTARLAREEESAFVRSRLEGYAEQLERLGVPRRLVRNLTHWPAFAIEMRVEQIFDQTPGPNAGTRVR